MWPRGRWMTLITWGAMQRHIPKATQSLGPLDRTDMLSTIFGCKYLDGMLLVCMKLGPHLWIHVCLNTWRGWENSHSLPLFIYITSLLISLPPTLSYMFLKSFYNSLGTCLAPKFQYPQLVGLYKTLFRNKVDNLIYLIRISPSEITQITQQSHQS